MVARFSNRMDKIKLCYIAGPFTAKDSWGEFLNIVTARVWAEDVMKKGYATYVPHVQNFATGLSWDEVMSRDLEVLSRCDCLCLLPGWEGSRGTLMEYKKAQDLGLKIYMSPMEVPDETQRTSRM